MNMNMEVIELNTGSTAIVPKGTKVIRRPGSQTLESTAQYMSLRFLDFEEKVILIEEKEKELEKNIEALKKILEEQIADIRNDVKNIRTTVKTEENRSVGDSGITE